MFDATFYVNSDLFEQLLLPGRTCGQLCPAAIQRVQDQLTGLATGVDQDSFLACCRHAGIPREYSTAVYCLAYQYFNRGVGGVGVDRQCLLLSLFIQLFEADSRRLRRSSSVDRISTEFWPGYRGSLRVEKQSPKSYDEEMHVNFYKRLISKLWHLLQDRTAPCLSPVWSQVFTINCSNTEKDFQGLYNAVPYAEMPQVISKNLKTTLDGVLHCIKTGKRLTWPLGDVMVPKKSEVPKMATNAHQTNRKKTIVLNNLFHKTLGRSSDTLRDADVRIHRCKNSYFYLLSSLQSVSIYKCINTTIVTGPVHTIIRVKGCRQLELISLASMVLVCETSNSKLCLRSGEKIILDGETCANIQIHPYSANYLGLERDIKRLRTNLRFDPEPLVINNQGLHSPRVYTSSADDFTPFHIPFQGVNMDPVSLPEEYVERMKKRKEVMDMWKSFFKTQDLSPEVQARVDTAVEKEFSSWLSGHSRELTGLISLAQQIYKP